ncbi:ribonuclease HIII [Anoxybacillus calidus]|uniref:Ribonuclease HIII n=1 Tax=[Anoxybacillus] calidus TaxID=575178 RepID=A0A7W0BVM1_9BACL|nr:ribonuclease HIII [Anoxybacillus calidus]MBA2871690.1 ribonuclease HIII [Anoxybacillus calidus]
MSNTVIKATEFVMKEMERYYYAFLLDKIPNGALFTAKLPDCTITAYKSGKVLFQGKAAEQEAARWQEKESAEPSLAKSHSTNLPANFSSLSIIGSDEVGTGDYFGPITVVATYVSKEKIPVLQQLGVKDSKTLTDEKISLIAKQLIKEIPYSLFTLHNEKYNQLQASGMSQGKMKALLHNQAIIQLLDKIAPARPDAILIDQFVESSTYYNYLKGKKTIVKESVYFSTKAEGLHLAVAAASIIARYAFLKAMDSLSHQAGIELPKGAGTQVDIAAAKLIKTKGLSALNKYAKLHFANTEKAKKLANM